MRLDRLFQIKEDTMNFQIQFVYRKRILGSDEKVPTGKREQERKEGKRKRTPVRKPLHDPRIRKTLMYRERIN